MLNSCCQNTALFHAVDDGKGSREVAVQPNLAALVFVQLNNYAEKLWEAAKVLHDHPQSLSAHCHTLWSGPQTLHTVLCSTPSNSLGAVWGQTPCLWYPCWFWTHTRFLVDGLQWLWIPICLGAYEQVFFLRWRTEWSPDSWSNLTFLPCFWTRWWWLHHRDHLEVCPAPNNKQGAHGAYCVMLVLLLSRALVESCWPLLPCHSSTVLWLW